MEQLGMMKKDRTGNPRMGSAVSGQPCCLGPWQGLGLWLHSGRGWCPWLTLPLENMEMSLVGAAIGDHVDIQGLCKIVPAPHPSLAMTL